MFRNEWQTYQECINEKLSTNLPVCKCQMDLPFISVTILNEITSVQVQTTKQVVLGVEDQFNDNNKKTAILDFKKKHF